MRISTTEDRISKEGEEIIVMKEMKEMKEDRIEGAPPMKIIEDHQLSQQGINNLKILKDKGISQKIDIPKNLKITLLTRAIAA